MKSNPTQSNRDSPSKAACTLRFNEPEVELFPAAPVLTGPLTDSASPMAGADLADREPTLKVSQVQLVH